MINSRPIRGGIRRAVASLLNRRGPRPNMGKFANGGHVDGPVWKVNTARISTLTLRHWPAA
jgi:hypothetical protein